MDEAAAAGAGLTEDADGFVIAPPPGASFLRACAAAVVFETGGVNENV